MALRATTLERINWLDFYSLYRLSGLTAYGAIESLINGDEVLQGSLSEIQAAATASSEEGKAIANSVADGMLAASPAVALIPVVGTVAGAVMAGVGVLIKGILSVFSFDCDAYDCLSPKTYYSRAILGANAPPGIIVNSDGKCYFMGYECLIVRFLHDGMVREGLDITDTESPEMQGRVRGVIAFFHGNSSKANKHWYNKSSVKPLNISMGNTRAASSSGKNTYAYRAFEVTRIKNWLEKLDCRTLKCLHEVLKNTKGVSGDSAFNQQRRRGGRWYASIYMMMQDLWEIRKKNPNAFSTGMHRLASQTGSDEIKKVAQTLANYDNNFRKANAEDRAFPWWLAFKHLQLPRLIETVKYFKMYLPKVVFQEQLKDYLESPPKAFSPQQIMAMQRDRETMAKLGIKPSGPPTAMVRTTSSGRQVQDPFLQLPLSQQAGQIKSLVRQGLNAEAKLKAKLAPRALKMIMDADPKFNLDAPAVRPRPPAMKPEVIVKPPPALPPKAAVPVWPFVAGGSALALGLGGVLIYKSLKKERIQT